MKDDDMESMLDGINPPKPERITHQEELKIPLLRYRRSSKAGLLLLILPLIVALTSLLKRELGLSSPLLKSIGGIIAAVDGHPVFTALIPLVVLGLPLTAIIVNLLAFSHFAYMRERKELLITLKYRPLNIGIMVVSLALLLFFFTPDVLSF